MPWGDHARCRAKVSQEVCRQGWDATDDFETCGNCGDTHHVFLSLNLTYTFTYFHPTFCILPTTLGSCFSSALWWNCPTEPALPSLQSMGSSWTLCPSGGAVAYKWTQLSGDTVRESLVRRLPPQLAEGLQKFLVVEPLRTGCWEPQIDWDSNFYILLCQGTSTALALINKSLKKHLKAKTPQPHPASSACQDFEIIRVVGAADPAWPSRQFWFSIQ